MSTPITIIGEGDSIALGSGSQTSCGFVAHLQYLLFMAGWVPSFVGSQVTGGDITNSGHEGYAGFRIDQLTALVANVWPVYRPDVVLMMGGTNDAGQGGSSATMLTRMAAFLSKARSARPQTWVCVSTTSLRTDSAPQNAEIQAYNAGLPSVVDAHVASGGRAVLIDAGGRLVAADLDTDGIHPRPYGYTHLAEYWGDGLLPFLEEHF